MTLPPLSLTGAQWDEIVAHLTASLPEEGCGLLAGRAAIEIVLPIENAEHSPVRYTMEPRALVAALARFEAAGMDLLGVFHSHPSGPFGVSDSDMREWRYRETALMVCVPGRAGWQGRAYFIVDGQATEIPVLVEQGARWVGGESN